MRNFCKFIPLVVFFMIVGCSRSNPRSQSPKFAHPIMHINVITADGRMSTGTAFVGVYRNRQFIITSTHVVYGAESIFICGNDGRILSKASGYFSPNLADISIIFPEKPIRFSHAYQLSSDQIPNGAPVLAIGYAHGGKKLLNVVGRFIAKIRIRLAARRSNFLMTNCKLFPGMSGGPLFYKNKVVAINTAKGFHRVDSVQDDNNKPEEKSLHISIKELLPTLDILMKIMK